MSHIDLPTAAEINKISNTTPFQPFREMNEQINALHNSCYATDVICEMFLPIEIGEFLSELHCRLTDIAKSYALMTFFFEKGIPDEKSSLSPGRNGASIEFLPDFDRDHYEIKDWFDYFSDTFYYKFFSALDMVGHVLNLQHGLGLEMTKVHFAKVVDLLDQEDRAIPERLKELVEIRSNSVMIEANKMRNNITHNHLPSSPGMSVTHEKGEGWIGATLGTRKYTSSSEVMENSRKAIELLAMVVAAISE